MIQRCNNHDNPGYMNYGGRGIRVCAGLTPFDGFLSVLGESPPGLEIDRMDNDGNYTCGRCDECLKNGWPLNLRWATRKQSARNKRSNRLVTVRGVTACLIEQCERFSVPYRRTLSRLNSGWNAEDAFFKPLPRRYEGALGQFQSG